MDTILSIDLIISNPNVRNGRAVIVGTSLAVSDVVAVMLFHGQNPDELAAWFDLSLAQVHAALAYYYQNQAALKAEISANLQQADKLKELLKQKTYSS